MPYGVIYARKIKAHLKHGANFLLNWCIKSASSSFQESFFGSSMGAAFCYGLNFDKVNENPMMWPFEG